MDARADLLAEHSRLTNELTNALRARGELVAASIRAHSETWRAAADRAVTDRRETARDATTQFEIEKAKTDGEVAALQAEIAHVELLLANLSPPDA